MASRLDALTREAITWLSRGRADQAGPIVAEMCELLPDRPDLARQMRRIVALMSFEWPAERGPARLAAVPKPKPGDVEVVAFHAAVGREAELPAYDYGRLLAQLYESARLRAPGCRRVLLTDANTALPDLGPGVEVLRVPVDTANLMYERMRVQRDYLRRRFPSAATVFVDSDVVVNADPTPLFVENFDVGLTYRPVVDAPFNAGVIFVAPGAGGLRFFDKALECYAALADAAAVAPLYARSLRSWWGDQFALAALVGWRTLAERGEEVALSVDGLRVRLFACDTHNYTVEPRAYAPGELDGKYFLHFKGPRKEMMEAYLQSLRGKP